MTLRTARKIYRHCWQLDRLVYTAEQSHKAFDTIMRHTYRHNNKPHKNNKHAEIQIN